MKIHLSFLRGFQRIKGRMKMKTSDKLERAYNIIFEEYKESLEYLGIPVKELGIKRLNDWFDIHLVNIEKKAFKEFSLN